MTFSTLPALVAYLSSAASQTHASVVARMRCPPRDASAARAAVACCSCTLAACMSSLASSVFHAFGHRGGAAWPCLHIEIAPPQLGPSSVTPRGLGEVGAMREGGRGGGGRIARKWSEGQMPPTPR